MAAAMNGLALHGGVIPYGGTFMVFSDYSRPAIRLGALMGVRAIHVLTHDSIGLGEDGPTHQPVEHLAALRAIPNLLVFRPADTVEAMEAGRRAGTQGRPVGHGPVAPEDAGRPHCGLVREPVGPGAYEIRAAKGEAKVTLFGTGTELALALAAADALEAEGTPTRVVSVPCFELFFQQDAPIRPRSSAAAPSASPSRPRSSRAGSGSSARTAPSSA
jgi:transketolase